MHLLSLWLPVVLIGTVAACKTAGPLEEADRPQRALSLAPYPAPMVTTLAGPNPLMTVVFRSEAGVPISEAHPARLQIGEKSYQGKLSSGPARSVEPGGTVVDRAVYVLSQQVHRDLSQAPPDSVEIAIHDGEQFWAYPYRTGNLVE